MRRGIVRSCHDLSDGGFWAALAECSLGGRLGASVDLDAVPTSRETERETDSKRGRESERLLFCETPSRLLVTISPRDRARLARHMAGTQFACIGEVTADARVRVAAAGREQATIDLSEIARAWKREGREAL
jgi:phosphoribosylformylglycinamidine synthase